MTRSTPALLILALSFGCNDEDTCPEDTAGCPEDTAADWVDADGDGVIAGVDCDDTNAAVYPGAADVCDGVDNDCDGETDEDGIGGSVYYADADEDGAGDPATALQACVAPDGWVTNGTDCDDTDHSVHPGADEFCDGIDNDCDGTEIDAEDVMVLFADTDGDGYGDVGDVLLSCSETAGWVAEPSDCDDTDYDVHPGADEYCDGLDNDCNGEVDDQAVDATTWYPDFDGDGYGNTGYGELSCEPIPGYLEDSSDCNDLDDAVYPGSTEYCNGEDDDCDGTVDEPDAVDASTWYLDADGDGYGDPESTAPGCTAPDGYVESPTDCNDDDATVSPDATEICEDGIDNDCDGTAIGCRLSGTETAADADVIVTGSATSDYFGSSTDFVGDLDADGYDDVVVGAYGNDAGGSSAGAAYVFYGDPGYAGTYGCSLGAALTGVAASDYAGYSVAGAGDLDADGYDDLIVGAYGVDTGGSTAGAVYLFYGGSTRLSGTASVSTADATFNGEASSSYLGYGLNPAGDVDGDGYDDMLLGAYYTSSGSGTVYLVYGDATGLAGTVSLTDSPRWTGGATYDYLGHRYGIGSGDFDGDGYSDLAMGAYAYDDVTTTLGAVYVVLGSGTRYTGSAAASTADTMITGVSASGDTAFGYSVAGGGDMNGDGYDELLVGGYYYDSPVYDAGGGFVFFGESGGWADSLTASDAGFVITGVASSDYVGRDVGSAGDLDGDGCDDAVFGASGTDDPASSAGSASVVFGTTTLSGNITYEDADFIVTGDASSDYVGYGIGNGGDLDGDGYSDLLVGQYGTTSSTGAAVLFYGSGW